MGSRVQNNVESSHSPFDIVKFNKLYGSLSVKNIKSGVKNKYHNTNT